MGILLSGATDLVGQGVLRECLHDPGVLLAPTVGLTPTGTKHVKLRETELGLGGLLGDRGRAFRLRGLLSLSRRLAAGLNETEYAHLT